MGRRPQRFLKSEQLESRRPLAADLAALDVNDDMSVTALDALIIINEINQASSSSVSTAEAEDDLDCDTNSDGVVTPVDVLNVVNQINSGEVVVPDAPADTTTSDTVDTTPTDSDAISDVVESPVDVVDVTSPSDSSTDDSDNTDSDNTDPDDADPDDADAGDDTSDDTNDDSTDDVVTDPSDGSTDDTPDDTDDSSDDNTGDDSDSDTETGCEHGQRTAPILRVISETIHGRHGRGDLFANLDANDDGALSSDEVPSAIWKKLAAADADASGTVTSAELVAYREAQRVAAVEAVFEQLDSDASGSITSADVSRLTWRFLSRADADNDGAITIDELLATPLPGRFGSH